MNIKVRKFSLLLSCDQKKKKLKSHVVKHKDIPVCNLWLVFHLEVKTLQLILELLIKKQS